LVDYLVKTLLHEQVISLLSAVPEVLFDGQLSVETLLELSRRTATRILRKKRP
jgi:hypothetical protein